MLGQWRATEPFPLSLGCAEIHMDGFPDQFTRGLAHGADDREVTLCDLVGAGSGHLPWGTNSFASPG